MAAATKDILKHFWGYDDFRPSQEAVIHAVLKGDDVMVIMPTGGGKSICYQVPALAQEGVCIVISPLIALMKDQVDQLIKRGIRADAVFSGLTRHEIDIILDNAVYGTTKFLYVSPERLETEIFKERVKKMNVSLVAVDEAHCISQWGYDFRPSYLNVAALKEILPDTPFMALTASATPPVRKDIIEKLALEPKEFISSFRRDNISFVTRKVENKSAKLLEILQRLGGSGIIYVRSRRKAADVAAHLLAHEYSATFYHAGLTPDQRDERQKQWMTGEVAIMVCTNAFGMGIDKSSVRFVIHWDIPDSLEAYYQEAGRAGRDGQLSYAILLYRAVDTGRLSGDVKRQFPEIKEIRRVYNALCNYLKVALHNGYMMSFDFDMLQFAKTYRLEMMKSWSILRILEKEGYLLMSDSVRMPSRLKFTIASADLYKFQVANPRWDKLVQALLRTYGGILDHYIPVNEKYLADRTGVSEKVLIQHLKKLTTMGILNYIAYKQNPSVTLLKNRLPDKSLIIDREFWKTRKAVAEEKVKAIINYCTSDSRCKQIMMADYFGEMNAMPCGKCSSCIDQKASELTEGAFMNIKSYLLDRLAAEPVLRLKKIEEELGYYEKQHYTMTVRRLVDEGTLSINAQQEISMNN